ncbi:MAG: hypothetical protein K0R69_2152 [Clostridia bacterium]|jgi:hypothetical protein|nr:hypothetical protein [Clostridia bacterium]
MFKKLKKAINKLLLKIAQQNEEVYGKARMDCCKLNKTDKR